MWAKTLAVLAASLLLMGSKLVIVVPEGGAVVSSSGLVTCSARETCTVDTANDAFAEAFTAVAAPGYEFIGWRSGDGAVCGGSRDVDCTELDASVFAEHPAARESSDFASARTLRPNFAADVFDQAAPASRFSVRSFHRAQYYEVSGETERQVWQALHSAANPLATQAEKGGKPLGFASFHVQYTYQPEYVANGADCRVASADIEFTFETTLPRLSVSSKANSGLEHRWQRFQSEVIEHEAGHIALYRQLVTELPEVMARVAHVPCSELGEHVRVAVAESIDTIKQANIDYDRDSDAGPRLAALWAR